MKKVLLKISVIFLVLVLGYQQFCYADVITVTDMFNKSLDIFGWLIGVLILTLFAISYFCLKLVEKKKNIVKDDNQNMKKTNTDEIVQKKDEVLNVFFVCSIIINIIGILYIKRFLEILSFRMPVLVKESNNLRLFFGYMHLILFGLLIISIVLRLKKKKKISNMISTISLIIIFLAWGWIYNVNSFNNQFKKYHVLSFSFDYVINVEGLINSTIKNNMKDRKVTIIYNNENYTNSDELKQLLTKVNNNTKYTMDYEYDNNYLYIKSITLKQSNN